MNKCAALLFALLTAFVARCDLTSADFLVQPSYTTILIWGNYYGIVLEMDKIYPYMNLTRFQGYAQNSNIRGDWYNNFALSLRMPRGWFYNCSLAITGSSTAACSMELQGNDTFFNQFGEFVWNTCSQPYYTIGLNNEQLNLADPALRANFYHMFEKIYFVTHSLYFHVEMSWLANKAVENGLRTGSYTVENFLADASQYEQIMHGFYYRSGGITDDADPIWMDNYAEFFRRVEKGVFTLDCVIFHDLSLVTIENLLSDNYTKYYMKRRTTFRANLSYSSFPKDTSISNTRLTNGNGVDGVTNTMAAAIWAIDFAMEACLYNIYDIHFDSAMYAGNYQGIIGPAPEFEPSSLYYALISLSFINDRLPKVVIPAVTSGTSSKIKVWGLQSAAIMKFVIINKDTNTSLNGKVTINTKSSENELLKCIYMEAPSLTSKANDMTLAGFKYVGTDPHPQGTYHQVFYSYNKNEKNYKVDIRYAQVALCVMTNANVIIPTEECWSPFLSISYLMILLGLITMLGL